MKTVLAVLLVVVLTLPAAAFDLGNRAPEKRVASSTSSSPASAALRQGGETIADAVPIPIPTIDMTGTTVGYQLDYPHECPYGSSAGDVVYSIVPDRDMLVDIDLCGSLYDTRVLVFDVEQNLVACNDDYYDGPPCGAYRSKIDNMPVTGGAEYFIVVGGYDTEEGVYFLDVVEEVPCELDCPADAVLENEPPLADGYVDLFNGGCSTDETDPPFQTITSPVFCGASGWYHVLGDWHRDTDWFTLTMPASGVLEIVGDAEWECYLFELGPQDCAQVGVVQNVVIGKCAEGAMTITGEPGATVWFWVGPTVFEGPLGQHPYEFDYVLRLDLGAVATEHHTWTEVKALFD